MRRLVITALSTLAVLVLTAPVVLAREDKGEGWYGETNDKVVTNAGFIIIAAIPAFILLMSLAQWRLEKRKEARKKAAKARAGSAQWRGGW